MIRLAAWEGFGLGQYAALIDDQPHLFFEGRQRDPGLIFAGRILAAKITARAGGITFLSLETGADAILDGAPDVLAKLVEGAKVGVRIRTEARADKSAVAVLHDGEGPDGQSTLKSRCLNRIAEIWPGQPLSEMAADKSVEALFAARDEALSPSGPLAGGGALTIEPTRALIACDVDGGGETGTTPVRRARLNEIALSETIRRLRLSGLAGLVVVDLIGRRFDFDSLRRCFDRAVAGEAAGHILAPPTRFGTLEFVRPWRACPLSQVSPMLSCVGTMIRVLREAEALARQDAGAMVDISGPAVQIEALKVQLAQSFDPLTARLRLKTDLNLRDLVARIS